MIKKLFGKIGAAGLIAVCLIASGCDFSSGKGQGQTEPPATDPDAFETYGPHLDIEGSVTKKGACVSRYDDGSALGAQNLADLNISWYYNWGASKPTDKIDAEYVPMIWGAGSVNERTLSGIRQGVQDGTYQHLLTFNEPDAATPGVSSGVSVETALSLWPQLEALGVPLSSPAPTYYGTGWLDEFMAGAKERGYRVDFIALHCYQDFSDPEAPEKLKEELTTVYERYQLPIWITEFAAIDITVWGGSHGKPACTEEAALRYTKDVTDMLEGLGFVERYAWFIDNTGSPSEQRAPEAQYTYLFENDDTMSATGEVYRDQVSRYPLFIKEETLPAGKVGEAYSVKLTGMGGRGGYLFSTYPETGETIPNGFTLDSSGRLYGTPQAAGAFKVVITLTDEDGQITYRNYTLTVGS